MTTMILAHFPPVITRRRGSITYKTAPKRSLNYLFIRTRSSIRMLGDCSADSLVMKQ